MLAVDECWIDLAIRVVATQLGRHNFHAIMQDKAGTMTSFLLVVVHQSWCRAALGFLATEVRQLV